MLFLSWSVLQPFRKSVSKAWVSHRRVPQWLWETPQNLFSHNPLIVRYAGWQNRAVCSTSLHYPVSLTNCWLMVNMYKKKASLLLASKPDSCALLLATVNGCEMFKRGICLNNSWACASNCLSNCWSSAYPNANRIQGCPEIFGVGISNTFILLRTRIIFLHSSIQPDVFYYLICHNCLYIIYKL